MSELVERLRKQVFDAVDWNGEILKRWDEIRGMVETRKGGDLPRLMFQDMIENLAELIIESADRIEALETPLQRIMQWSEAYPLDIFPEPDWKRAQTVLEAGGITLDAVSAHCMRHVVEGIGRIARAALDEDKERQDGRD